MDFDNAVRLRHSLCVGCVWRIHIIYFCAHNAHPLAHRRSEILFVKSWWDFLFFFLTDARFLLSFLMRSKGKKKKPNPKRYHFVKSNINIFSGSGRLYLFIFTYWLCRFRVRFRFMTKWKNQKPANDFFALFFLGAAADCTQCSHNNHITYKVCKWSESIAITFYTILLPFCSVFCFPRSFYLFVVVVSQNAQNTNTPTRSKWTN